MGERAADHSRADQRDFLASHGLELSSAILGAPRAGAMMLAAL
jgi:hypothetical protein